MSVRRIAGQVLDRNGAPVTGAVVSVEEGTAPTPEIGIVSGADGRFGIALPEGAFRIAAGTDDGRRGTAEVEVGPDRPGSIEVIVK